MIRLALLATVAAVLVVGAWKWAHPQTHRTAGWTWDDSGALVQDDGS